MPTFSELVDEVLSHQFAVSQYTDFSKQKLNEAQAYLCAQTDFRELETSYTQTTTDGYPSYYLPSDYQRIYTVNLVDSDSNETSLESFPRDAFDRLAITSGEPQQYSIQGNTIRLWPTPDAAYSLKLDYFAKPTELTGDADTPQIPEQYQYLMVHRTLKACYERENDYNSAQYHKNEFEEGVMKMRGEVQYDTSDYSQPRILGEP